MAAIIKLGTFKLASSKVVITDPNYTLEVANIEGLGCFIKNCAIGAWHADLVEERPPDFGWELPHMLLAVLDGRVAPSDGDVWRHVGHVGSDSAKIGIFDLAHFHDATIVPDKHEWTYHGRPAHPKDLWASLCWEALRDRSAAVIPYGVLVHWDGGMEVETFSAGGETLAIRLSISGWPDNV